MCGFTNLEPVTIKDQNAFRCSVCGNIYRVKGLDRAQDLEKSYSEEIGGLIGLGEKAFAAAKRLATNDY